MKKVLFISYFFPPVGGGGVIRIAKFVKYLPIFGWQPFILTAKKVLYPFRDPELLKELPRAVQIKKINYFEPGFWIKSRRWQSFLIYLIYPWFLIPDRQILWLVPAIIAARKIIRKEKIKVIFTSSAPATDHLIGWFLKKLTNVKWVADFRDEWSNNPLQKFPTPIHRWLNKFWEKRIVRAADKITSVSEPLTSYLETLWPAKDKFLTLTNGFDQEDFSRIQNSPKRKKYFHLLYSGTLYHPQITQPFWAAIQELNLADLKASFIGLEKRASHRQSVEILQSADVLLLILDPIDRPAVMTGKFYEYLAARKPILALAPENTGVAKLIKKLKVGRVVPTLDKEKIKKSIKHFYQKYQKGILNIPQITIDQYERKYLTGQLAKIFQGCLKPLKLVIIGNLAAPQNQLLVRNLLKFPIKIKFFSTQKVNFKQIEVFYLGRLSYTPLYFFKTALKVRKWVKRLKPDIIHGQDLVFAGIWAYLSGLKRLVLTVWGSDVINFKHFFSLERLLIRRTLKRASLVTGPAWHLRRRCQKIGLLSKNYHLVHFGVDPNQFYPKTVFNLRQKYLRRKVIFCPRTIAPIYNTDILIEAFLKIQNTIPSHLILLGKNADEKYLIQIEKRLIQANLLDKVTILPGLSPSQMNNYFNLADVIVSLASSDGCPNSFLESLAVGAKIVVTNLPFTHEWPGTKFWRVPVRNVLVTVKTLKVVLKYPQNRWQKPSKKNRELVLKNANAFSHAQKLYNLYESLR